MATRSQAGVGLERVGVADSTKKRRVVDAVRVGVALRKVDRRSRAKRRTADSFPRPQTKSPSIPPLKAPAGSGVSSGDTVVETDGLGERGHEIGRRRGGEHEQVALFLCSSSTPRAKGWTISARIGMRPFACATEIRL